MIEIDNIIKEENNLDYEYFDDDSNEYDEMGIENTSKLKRTLDIKKYDRMIKDIISSVEDGSIILTPEYQRNYLWDNKKSSKLIESILLNIPIPVIYASEEQSGKWNIVDGLQRLNTFTIYPLSLSILDVFLYSSPFGSVIIIDLLKDASCKILGITNPIVFILPTTTNY